MVCALARRTTTRAGSANTTVTALICALLLLTAFAAPTPARADSHNGTHVIIGVTPNSTFQVTHNNDVVFDLPVVADAQGILGFVIEDQDPSAGGTVCILPPGPPQVTGQEICGFADTTATICWRTNWPATSQVEYGTTTAYGGSTPVSTDLVLSHEIDVTPLATETTYHCRAVSVDAFGNRVVSGDMTFTTNPLRPIITEVTVVDTTETTATITWLTSTPSSSQAEYGTTTAYGSIAGAASELALEHELVIENLEPDELYHFCALSTDVYGQDASSDDHVFVTRPDEFPDALVIEELGIIDVMPDEATVWWTTSQPATSLVEYGVDETYGLSALDFEYVAFHELTLPGLDVGTVYHYRVLSINAGGGVALTDDATFETPPSALEIGPVTIVDLTPSAFTVGWDTNRPASSQVEYGLDEWYGDETALDPTPTTHHAVTVAGLEPSRTYHFRTRSVDGYGSPGVSGDHTVTTAAAEIQIYGLSVVDTTATSAVVAWQTVVDASSTVEYGTAPNCPLSVHEPGPTTHHEVELTGLRPGTIYYYRARSAGGGSEGVSPVYAFETRSVSDFMPPQVPAGFSAEAGPGKIALHWEPNQEPDLGGYRVYRRAEPEEVFTLHASIAAGITSYTDTDVVDGSIYEYAIASFDDAGNESVLSAIIKTVPGVGLGGSIWIYPNPVGDETTIRFVPPRSARDGDRYDIRIYDATGRLIRTVASGTADRDRGPLTIRWDATDSRGRPVGSGIYFCVATCSAGSVRTKVMVLR